MRGIGGPGYYKSVELGDTQLMQAFTDLESLRSKPTLASLESLYRSTLEVVCGEASPPRPRKLIHTTWLGPVVCRKLPPRSHLA